MGIIADPAQRGGGSRKSGGNPQQSPRYLGEGGQATGNLLHRQRQVSPRRSSGAGQLPGNRSHRQFRRRAGSTAGAVPGIHGLPRRAGRRAGGEQLFGFAGWVVGVYTLNDYTQIGHLR